MNVKQIVKQYLTENGYDGLRNGFGCGCRKSNLFLCNYSTDHCLPGYIKGRKDEFGNKTWAIVPKKEEKP
jgi:hypothetical protein